MKNYNLQSILAVVIVSILFLTTRCSTDNSNNNAADNSGASSASATTFDTLNDIGIGPVTARITLGAIDDAMADSGSKVFSAKCVACHALDKKVVGPALSGVTKRVAPEWIMNQILNPSEMTSKDPIAKDLLGKYIAQMANQNLTQQEARQVLEYFRKNDSK